ncbi:MAG: SpoIVB peptidase S55 domain protein [Selenomonadaceae bacterium]|nr:SpoIVB peptidase S55 domain protein [Selenomonadaceae bacterium]
MIKKSILCLTLLTFCNTAFAARDILPISSVYSGQVGTAYTEADSTGSIYPFTITVDGVTGDKNTQYIMAKASGSLMNATNGVLQGMSGSPVFVDGKLMGAVSAGFKGMDAKTCLITPIEEMRKLWKMADRKNNRKIEPFDLAKALEKRREEEKTELRKKIEKKLKDAKDAKDAIVKRYKEEETKNKKAEAEKKTEDNAKTENNENAKINDKNKEEKVNVFLTGFNDEGRKFLKEQLFKGKNMDFLENASVGGVSGNIQKELKPGSALGVALSYGDFAIAATGTVTDVDGAKILAFGHPFTHRGNVNYFMTNATVVGSIPSNAEAGAKMANLGDVIGRINQDREVGISGVLREFPETVKVNTQVVDFALGKNKSYKSYVAYDEELLTPVTASLMYAAIAKTTDTTGEATARISCSIKSDMIENGVYKHENMIYAPSDFGKIAILEVAEPLNILATNPEKDSAVQDIEIKVEIAEGRHTARLVSAIPEKSVAKAGDKVNFKVTLRPYRGKDETVTIPYFVPYTQAKGDLTLDVRGGGLIPLTTDTSMFAQEGLGEDTKTKLKKLSETSSNNDIVIAPGAPAALMSENEQKKMIQRALEAQENAEAKFGAKLKNPPKNKPYKTNYVIENYVKTRIKIEG